MAEILLMEYHIAFRFNAALKKKVNKISVTLSYLPKGGKRKEKKNGKEVKKASMLNLL